MSGHYKQTAVYVPGPRPSGYRPPKQATRAEEDARQARAEAADPPTYADDVEAVRAAVDMLIPRSPAALSLANGMSKRVILPVCFELIQYKCDEKTKRAIKRIQDRWKQEDMIAEAVEKEKQRKARLSGRDSGGEKRPGTADLQRKPKPGETEAEAVDSIVASHFTDPFWQKPGRKEIARKIVCAHRGYVAVAEGSDSEVLANSLTFRDMQQDATYSGNVYNGGELNQDFSPFPVYVELSSVEPILSANQTQPSLKDHAADRPVGHHFVRVEADKLSVHGGVFSVDNQHSREVVSAVSGGYQWQASVRGKFSSVVMLKKNQSQTINGKTVKGPALLAKNFRWRETSWTGLGANQPDENGVGASFEVIVRKAVKS